MDRREFISALGIFTAGVFSGKSPISEKFFEDDKKKNSKNSTEPYEEIKRFLEAKHYPNPEEVPELLREYTSKFNSWYELVLAQKGEIVEFFKSDLVKEKFIEILKITFPKIEEDEINDRVVKLIELKLANIENIYLNFKEIEQKRMVAYYDSRDNSLNADTLKMAPHEEISNPIQEGNYKVHQIDMFIFAHDFWHSVQTKNLMLKNSFQIILEKLKEDDLIKKYNFDSLDIDNLYKSNISELGTLEEIKNKTNIDYEYRIEEILSFLFEIKNVLHEVSKTHRELINFDLYEKDGFKDEHYDFLVENQEKLFAKVEVYDKEIGGLKTKNVFSGMPSFKKENFIYLMNNAI